MGMKSILVTGAAGFTGRHFIDAATRAGYACTALCRYEEETVACATRNLACDILDRDALFRAVDTAQPDAVVHLAAVSFVAHEDTASIYQANLLGTLNLLDAIAARAPGVERVLVASSANVYGNAATLPIDEDTPPDPLNHYAASKYAMEMAARLYAGIPMIVTRPFNYTGVGQPGHFLVPKLVDAYRAGERRILLGNLDVARDFSDVRDTVAAYLGLLRSGSPHETYNVCSGRSVSLRSILDSLAEIAGYSLEIEQDPGLMRDNEILDLYGSTEKLDRAIGARRRFSLRDTLTWMLSE